MEVVNMRDKVENEQTSSTYNMINKQEAILQLEETTNHNTSPPPTATASPPSASASPTHDFSFTISLHPNPPSKQDGHNNKYYNDHTYNDKHHNTTSCTTSTTPPSEPLTAIDLSPADDIFFHGHLLPLHLLSHLPISPRSSTNSMDSFTLPMKDILKDQNNPIGNTSFHYHHRNTFSDFNLPNTNNVNYNQPRPKSKSFSIFNRPKSKKDEKEGDHNEDPKAKKKLKLEVTQLIKRYMKMVRPMLSFQKTNNKRSNNNNNNTEIYNRQQPHSYSGNMVSSRSNNNNRSLPLIRRGDQFSAPASMRTSPGNSGVLLASSGTISPSAKSSTSDSTMEELQAAIQSAIAYCKNSIAMDDTKIIHAA
uniref:BRI1 kinase inhibitor 1-like n=1 Tax=Erigeron canadensis TaxID=72917 RepID=UPI001CB9B7DE|nr:BRI1 kinase inhibitor 1-like [Erigeron canadensis]